MISRFTVHVADARHILQELYRTSLLYYHVAGWMAAFPQHEPLLRAFVKMIAAAEYQVGEAYPSEKRMVELGGEGAHELAPCDLIIAFAGSLIQKKYDTEMKALEAETKRKAEE